MAINVSMVSSRFLKPWKSATADFSNSFFQQVRPDFISFVTERNEDKAVIVQRAYSRNFFLLG
jgi:hypothetical protein